MSPLEQIADTLCDVAIATSKEADSRGRSQKARLLRAFETDLWKLEREMRGLILMGEDSV